MKRAKLLWVDLEMTGLDPEKDRILEVAAIATGWDLEKIPGAEMTAVVKVPEKLMKERMVGEFWEKNAESRDALTAQNAEGRPAAEVEKMLLEFMDKYFGPATGTSAGVGGSGAASGAVSGAVSGAGEIYLAGNSVHQDRKFIDREWPEVAKRLHYRILDVSAWKVYFEGALGKKYTKREAHRALDDIEGSIAELKWYTEIIK